MVEMHQPERTTLRQLGSNSNCDDCWDFFDVLGTGLLIVSAGRTILSANAAASTLLGLPADQLIGRPPR